MVTYNSLVRKLLGVPFEGFTEQEKQLMVGDVEVEGLTPDGDLDSGDQRREPARTSPCSGSATAARSVEAKGIEGLQSCLLGELPAAYGLSADTLVLVRPDGYIALTAPAQESAAVLGYFASLLGGAVSATAV